MKISVTAEDIAQGVALKCQDCPVALAIARVVKPVAPAGVMVGAYAAILWNNVASREIWSADLPKEARGFILAFDNGDPVQPFDFDLEIPA